MRTVLPISISSMAAQADVGQLEELSDPIGTPSNCSLLLYSLEVSQALFLHSRTVNLVVYMPFDSATCMHARLFNATTTDSAGRTHPLAWHAYIYK